MGEPVAEERAPEERSTEELLKRFQQSARDVVEGRTSPVEEVIDRIEGN